MSDSTTFLVLVGICVIAATVVIVFTDSDSMNFHERTLAEQCLKTGRNPVFKVDTQKKTRELSCENVVSKEGK